MHLLRITLIVLGLYGTLEVCQADSAVYGFVDDQGALFLSNIPDDDRYQRLDTPSTLPNKIRIGLAANNTDDAGVRRLYGAVIAQVAEQYGIEAALLHAVISVESGYNAKAVSKRGAAGLMQLMPETAKRYAVRDVFDPADNVRAGAQYLKELLKLFNNDIPLVLAAYNAGEAAVIKYGRRIPPYSETAGYVPKVVRFYEKFRLLM